MKIKTKYDCVIFEKVGEYEWCASDSVSGSPLGLIYFSRAERTGIDEWVLAGFTQYRIKLEHLPDIMAFMSRLTPMKCKKG